MIPKYPAYVGNTNDRHDVTAYCNVFKSIGKRSESDTYFKKKIQNLTITGYEEREKLRLLNTKFKQFL